VSLAKNGMLQLKMNLMKKQKQKADDRVRSLESEKEALKIEYDEQTQLLLLLQQQYDIIDKELKEERAAKAEVKEKRAQERWKLAAKSVKVAETTHQLDDLKGNPDIVKADKQQLK
jgi:chromosome segregation ATPase